MTISIAPPPVSADAPAAAFEDSKCGRCIALCCRYFALEIDTPDEPADFDNLRWYLLHERTALFIEDGDWFLQIYSKCTMLGDDNRCMDYEHRPTICREYSDEACDYDGTQGELVLRNVEELEAYRVKWVAEWERKREKRRRARARRRKARPAARSRR